MNLSNTQKVKIVDVLLKTQPDLIKHTFAEIDKPTAPLSHFYQLLRVFNAYNRKKGFESDHLVGKDKGGKQVWDRTVFLAVVIKLYSPASLMRNVSYDLRDNLREEISGLLEVDATWISQKVSEIAVTMGAYDEFRVDIETMYEFIREEIKESEPVKQEQLLFANQ